MRIRSRKPRRPRSLLARSIETTEYHHMKSRIGLVVIALSAAPRLLAAQAARCADRIITGDRVGVIRIGMTLDSVRHRCAIVREAVEMNEGEPERVIYALVAGDTLSLYLRSDSVSGILVRRSSFRTADSIHVGMSLSRFLVGRKPTINVGEGSVALETRDHCGIAFGLSGEAFARVTHLTTATLSRLPRSTKIEGIFVSGAALARQYGACD